MYFFFFLKLSSLCSPMLSVRLFLPAETCCSVLQHLPCDSFMQQLCGPTPWNLQKETYFLHVIPPPHLCHTQTHTHKASKPANLLAMLLVLSV